MKRPPRIATTLLAHFAPDDGAFIGDLQERYELEQSSAWYWHQTVRFLFGKAIRLASTDPLQSFLAIFVGWGVLAIVFALGDRAAYGFAAVIQPGWTRDGAYQSGVWWPFRISSTLVSYVGFALSAGAVARLLRGPHLFIYAASVWMVIVITTTAIQIYARPVEVAHPIYYLIAIALPFYWHTGLILVPFTMLVVGVIATSRPPQVAPR